MRRKGECDEEVYYPVIHLSGKWKTRISGVLRDQMPLFTSRFLLSRFGSTYEQTLLNDHEVKFFKIIFLIF